MSVVTQILSSPMLYNICYQQPATTEVIYNLTSLLLYQCNNGWVTLEGAINQGEEMVKDLALRFLI